MTTWISNRLYMFRNLFGLRRDKHSKDVGKNKSFSILDLVPFDIWSLIIPQISNEQIRFLSRHCATVRNVACRLKTLQEQQLLDLTEGMNPRTAMKAALSFAGFSSLAEYHRSGYKILGSPSVVVTRIKERNPEFVLPAYFAVAFMIAEDPSYIPERARLEFAILRKSYHVVIQQIIDDSICPSLLQCFLMGQNYNACYKYIISKKQKKRHVMLASAILAGHLKGDLSAFSNDVISFCRAGMGVYPEDGLQVYNTFEVADIAAQCAWGGVLHRFIIDRNDTGFYRVDMLNLVLSRFREVGLKDLNYLISRWNDTWTKCSPEIRERRDSYWTDEMLTMSNASLFWKVADSSDWKCPVKGCLDPVMFAEHAIVERSPFKIKEYLFIAMEKGPVFVEHLVSRLREVTSLPKWNEIAGQYQIHEIRYRAEFFKEFACYEDTTKTREMMETLLG